jgi:DNA (cytosine-5)-methyltransferase 1
LDASNASNASKQQAMPEKRRFMAVVTGSLNANGKAAMLVRRLTPTECERLQGFEDNWTRIDAKTADGPRYKAIGNSMAVPVMAFIGRRIQMVEDLDV